MNVCQNTNLIFFFKVVLLVKQLLQWALSYWTKQVPHPDGIKFPVEIKQVKSGFMCDFFPPTFSMLLTFVGDCFDLLEVKVYPELQLLLRCGASVRRRRQSSRWLKEQQRKCSQKCLINLNVTLLQENSPGWWLRPPRKCRAFLTDLWVFNAFALCSKVYPYPWKTASRWLTLFSFNDSICIIYWFNKKHVWYTPWLVLSEHASAPGWHRHRNCPLREPAWRLARLLHTSRGGKDGWSLHQE